MYELLFDYRLPVIKSLPVCVAIVDDSKFVETSISGVLPVTGVIVLVEKRSRS